MPMALVMEHALLQCWISFAIRYQAAAPTLPKAATITKSSSDLAPFLVLTPS